MTVAIAEKVAPADRYDVVLYLLSLHLSEKPTEGGRGHRDDWMDQVDDVLTELRVDLAAIGSER